MSKRLAILVVEDSASDAKLVIRKIEQAGYEVHWRRVETAADLKQALGEECWEAVLSDYSMPGFTGTDALAIVQASGRDLPFIFVSGTMGEDVAVQAMKAGAHDYVVKGNLRRLVPAIERELREAEERRRRRQAEAALGASEDRYRRLFESSRDALMTIAPPSWRFTDGNAAAFEMFGACDEADFYANSPWEYSPEFQPDGQTSAAKAKAMIEQAMRGGVSFCEWTHQRLSGEVFPATVLLTRVELNGVAQLQATVRDVTAQKQAEEEREAALRRERHLVDVLRSIRDVNELIVRTKEREPLIEGATGSLVSTRGFRGAWIILTDRLPGELQRAQAGFPDDAFRGLAAWVEAGHIPTCCERARAGNSVVAVANPASECGDCPLAPVCQGGSGLAVALAHGGKLFGCMGVSVPPEFANGEQEKSLLSEIAGDIAFALHGIETESDRRKSADTLRAIFQSASDGILLADAESARFVVANDAMCRMLGYTQEEIKGLSVVDIHPPDALEYVRAQFQKQARGEISLVTDAPMVRKDGTIFAADVNAASLELGGRRHVVGIFRDISERKRAENALRDSERALKKAQEIGCLGSWEWDVTCERLTWSDELYRVWGVAKGFALTQDSIVSLIHPDDRAANAAKLSELLDSGADAQFEFRIVRPDGATRTLLQIMEASRDAAGKAVLIAGIMQDITERKQADEEREKLQAQLTQAQKMESVGRLAGGVAHDFNNALGVILGRADLVMRALGPGDQLRRDMAEICDAALRSADLTRQLLVFARKQTIAPKVVDLNDAVAGMLTMLRRLIGEDIQLAWMPGASLGPVKMDPSQIDQLLANLLVNARDAIRGVGRVAVETQNVAVDEAYCAHQAGGVPGEYVMLAVSDDGCGMEKDVLDHLFEPFFTTKAAGQGTGLGLATVYGIVKQNSGFINVYSEPGRGTTFRLYLPRAVGEVPDERAARAAHVPRGCGETVLLVEDEPAMLEVGAEILAELGYVVLSAGRPDEALRLAQAHVGEIRLLITDVVMPEMNGRDLSQRLAEVRPGIRSLFVSGYTADIIVHSGLLDEGVHFLHKPFSRLDLAVKVRQALDP